MDSGRRKVAGVAACQILCVPAFAALVDGVHWVVLRLNGFPDHTLYTMFVDGGCIFDLEDLSLGSHSQYEPLTRKNVRKS